VSPPLRDSASLIWPGGMCRHRPLAAPVVEAGESQEGAPKAAARDAFGIRSLRLPAGGPGEKRTKTERRKRWNSLR